MKIRGLVTLKDSNVKTNVKVCLKLAIILLCPIIVRKVGPIIISNESFERKAKDKMNAEGRHYFFCIHITVHLR